MVYKSDDEDRIIVREKNPSKAGLREKAPRIPLGQDQGNTMYVPIRWRPSQK